MADTIIIIPGTSTLDILLINKLLSLVYQRNSAGTGKFSQLTDVTVELYCVIGWNIAFVCLMMQV